MNLLEFEEPSVEREAELLQQVILAFETCFFENYRTKLKPGAEEPFYRAPRESMEGEICFRANFLRSALHESAHWCRAGLARLKLDDWGYWYEPDGRSLEQQNEFFKVEIKPQAIEMAFCEALKIPFQVSVDNLGGPDGPVKEFENNVKKQFQSYGETGFPKRAELFRKALSLM